MVRITPVAPGYAAAPQVAKGSGKGMDNQDVRPPAMPIETLSCRSGETEGPVPEWAEGSGRGGRLRAHLG